MPACVGAGGSGVRSLAHARRVAFLDCPLWFVNALVGLPTLWQRRMGPTPEHPIHQPGGGLPEYGNTFDKPWNQRKQGGKPLSGDFDGQLVEQRAMSRALLGALDIELISYERKRRSASISDSTRG